MGIWLAKVRELQESIDSYQFIARACHDLPVSCEWVISNVLDQDDINDIENAKFPIACLIAHIRYKMNEHEIVETRNIGTYKTYKTYKTP
jgi:hypothetical protein